MTSTINFEAGAATKTIEATFNFAVCPGDMEGLYQFSIKDDNNAPDLSYHPKQLYGHATYFMIENPVRSTALTRNADAAC